MAAKSTRCEGRCENDNRGHEQVPRRYRWPLEKAHDGIVIKFPLSQMGAAAILYSPPPEEGRVLAHRAPEGQGRGVARISVIVAMVRYSRVRKTTPAVRDRRR